MDTAELKSVEPRRVNDIKADILDTIISRDKLVAEANQRIEVLSQELEHAESGQS